MPPLPHELAGFYNDRGATVDIPLDSTKVTDLHYFFIAMIFHFSLRFGADSHCFYIVLFARALRNNRLPFYFAHATYSICLSLFK